MGKEKPDDKKLHEALNKAMKENRGFFDTILEAAFAKRIDQLLAVNKEMRDYILNEARHGAGCSREFGKQYTCKCGLLKFQQALKSEVIQSTHCVECGIELPPLPKYVPPCPQGYKCRVCFGLVKALESEVK